MVEDKVCVVTGAGRGIGRAIAEMLAAHGAKVVVNDIGAELDGAGEDKGLAESVVEDIKKAGGDAVANTDSVATYKGAEGIIQTALDTYGKIDVVVNNAGILRDVIFHKMTEDDWDSVMNVMFKGAFNVSRVAATHFRAQSSGSYIHMTSTSGLLGNFGQANYGACKLGIVGFSKCIALDMARYQVRSNCIAPSAWSRMTSSIPTNTPEQQKRTAQRQQVTPAKNAPMAVYLASDMSRDVTGQAFSVRHNEIHLFGQPRPLRTMHTSDGWTPATIAERVIPAMRHSFLPLDRTADIFPWDPV
ncbi:MAG: SDR family oxidoreductase [Proteobacteria bacterium]|nr:SDR family oxidoreductase [Pseudomonadota bacterium]